MEGLILGTLTALLLLAGPPADASYYPLTEGTRWSYLADDGSDVDERVRAAVEVAGTRVAALTSADGVESYLVLTADGIIRTFGEAATAMRNGKVTWVLRFPLRLGDRWESWTPAGSVRFTVTDRGPVTTEGGVYADAVRVDFTAIPEPLFRGYIWYARNVGPVLVVEDEYRRSLVSFSEGAGAIPGVATVPGMIPPAVFAPRPDSLRFGLALLAVLGLVAGLVVVVPRMRRRITVGTVSVPASNLRYQWVATMEASREELEEAALHLEETVAKRPNYADLQCKLAEVYLQLGKAARAVDRLRIALEINPGYIQARLLLAHAHLRLDQASEARGALQPAADEHPEYADVRNLMGEIFRAMGDLGRARTEFSASLEINPNYDRARKNLDALEDAAS